MNKKQIWQAVLGEIEINISKAHFVTWFSNTFIESLDDEQATIAVPNGFSKEWLENKYGPSIKKAILKYCPEIKIVNYKIAQFTKPSFPEDQHPSSSSSTASSFSSPRTTSNENQTTNLNPRYVFDNLVVGSHNELARAACESVAQNPGHNYNPLFIYGGVGLGKTHLLQAVGNQSLKKKPQLKISYVTSEKFTSGLIDAIKKHQISYFKQYYQQIDVLLIDDIQFIGGKEKTQEEFFHIFNALYQENKQIVICSDRPPKSIATLEERLRSRFEGGMIVDVKKPDLETRIAILEKKAKSLGFSVQFSVIEYIAQNIHHNVRELEGALNRLIATCQLKNITPSPRNAKEILAESFSKISNQSLSPDKIIKAVCDFYSVEEEKITSKRRGSDIMRPRQIAAYLIRKETKLSFPTIGKELGGRDHTTIMHAFNKIKAQLKEDPNLKQEVLSIKEACF